LTNQLSRSLKTAAEPRQRLQENGAAARLTAQLYNKQRSRVLLTLIY
jgi:hypothetical protein